MKYGMIFFLAWLLILPAEAAGPDTAPLLLFPGREYLGDQQPESADLNGGLQSLLRSAAAAARRYAGESGKLALEMLSITVSVSLVSSFCKSGGLQLPERFADCAGVCAITALAMGTGETVLKQCSEALRQLVSYGDVFFPIYAGAAAASGHPVSATVHAGAAMLFGSLLLRLTSALFLPIVRGCILLEAAGLLSGSGLPSQLAKLIQKASVISIRVLLIGFTGYITVTGIVSGSADAMTVKAARLAVSTAVPVVGAIVADASNTILAGAAMLKNSIGVFGCLAVSSICLLPFVRALLHDLLFRLTAAVADPITTTGCSRMLRAVADGYSFALGLLATGCAVQFIFFVAGSLAVSG